MSAEITDDRETVLEFISTGGAKHHAAKEALRRLLDEKPRGGDRERLLAFVDWNSNSYSLTCAALERLLEGAP